LFCAIYALLFVAWVRIVLGLVKKGPEPSEGESAGNAGSADAAGRSTKVETAVQAAAGVPATASAEGGE